MNQLEFATRAGLSPQGLNGVEKARRDLSIAAAKRIRAAHGLDLEYLYYGRMDLLPMRIGQAILHLSESSG